MKVKFELCGNKNDFDNIGLDISDRMKLSDDISQIIGFKVMLSEINYFRSDDFRSYSKNNTNTLIELKFNNEVH
jgi:hypothetical protein